MQAKESVGIGLIIIFALIIGQGGWPSAAQAERVYDYINISDPFLKKIPIAVPVFKTMSGSSEVDAAHKAADILSSGIEFTGYFKLIDRGAFLETPREKGITAVDLNFDNWTDIGAELLITGGLWVTDDTVRLEIRLFDTFKGSLLFGKRYGGDIVDLRQMVHRFCGEMLYRLTGNRGLFNSRIVFINKDNGKNAIYTCDFDGHGPRRVVEGEAITLSPSWSPDGRAIAYTSYAGGEPNISIRGMESGETRRISYEGINITPCWLPGSSKLAATLSVNGDEEIYLLTDSGKIDKRLTDSWGIDVSPSFSPDGSEMAFVSKRSGSPQVYIQELGSGDVRRLTYEGSYNTEPAWSPDGSLIVFSSTRSGKAKLYVMTASGTDQRPLLDMPGEQVLPDWSPAIETR